MSDAAWRVSVGQKMDFRESIVSPGEATVKVAADDSAWLLALREQYFPLARSEVPKAQMLKWRCDALDHFATTYVSGTVYKNFRAIENAQVERHLRASRGFQAVARLFHSGRIDALNPTRRTTRPNRSAAFQRARRSSSLESRNGPKSGQGQLSLFSD
jgi:hypothetical protein